MNKAIIIDPEYKNWISEICINFRRSQLKATHYVNTEMLRFYWYLGKEISQKQEISKWGEKVISV